MNSFEQLPLILPILNALKEEGYTRPTPIQARAIPIILERNDLFGIAQTGTGKTAAFSIPILQIIHEELAVEHGKKHIKALICTPTRELAIQIGESLETYGRHLNIRHAVIFGGVDPGPQISRLRGGLDILVATPGRLLDLLGQKVIDLSQLRIFVLDEADRMLDMGFINDIRKIITYLPKKKQSLFFSATLPPEIAKLAAGILHHPQTVEVTPVSSAAEKVGQVVYRVDKENKRKLLVHLLKEKNEEAALVFSRTKHGADRIAKILAKAGIGAAALHSDKSQNARQNALNAFKSGKMRVLVATDIASRGIDIEELPLVINYDLPNIPETYVHRIGRTGRAEASGSAISFCDNEETEYLRDIEKLMKKKIPLIHDHPYPVSDVSAVIAPKEKQNAGRKDHRGKKPSHRRGQRS